jgi:hypothetical protein
MLTITQWANSPNLVTLFQRVFSSSNFVFLKKAKKLSRENAPFNQIKAGPLFFSPRTTFLGQNTSSRRLEHICETTVKSCLHAE